ncbi:HNH endonuclease signature motif containing protein [Roseovarius sp. MMSF_3281]|uniref:HNH endonuclease signature motif containing protein n=1 Tax=Roseovarius sp. MMSF_3281 TaxID=3046694 RepID=UPI00273D3EBE|nr:HNH endonuclease signature motif containing protein [Roseovarius sp. MMSF_3281]
MKHREFLRLMEAARANNADGVKSAILPFLNELLAYDPKTGSLTWRQRARRWFQNNHAYRLWNSRYAGEPALATVKNHGYKCGAILGVYFLSHRVIWAMVHGEWPDECDHINGLRSDNRIKNLRNTDKSGNQRNAGLRSDNTSGRVGVYRALDREKWGANIFHHGRLRHLGFFEDFSDAVAARESAEVILGYHENQRRGGLFNA